MPEVIYRKVVEMCLAGKVIKGRPVILVGCYNINFIVRVFTEIIHLVRQYSFFSSGITGA
jgi:hypothetical protein